METSIVEAGRLAQQGIEPDVEVGEGPVESGDSEGSGRTTLKDLIEKALIDSMTSTAMTAVRQQRTHRGKGRPGNGDYPNLIGLHRDLGRTNQLEWLEGSGPAKDAPVIGVEE